MDEWRAAMLRSRTLKSGPKLTLLVLMDHIDDEDQIRVHHEVIGKELGIARQRVSEHVSAAVAAGWIEVTQKGTYGRPAVMKPRSAWLTEVPSTARNPGLLRDVTARKTGLLADNSTETRTVRTPQQSGKTCSYVEPPVVTAESNHAQGEPGEATTVFEFGNSSSSPGSRATYRPRGRLGPRPAPSTATTDDVEAI